MSRQTVCWAGVMMALALVADAASASPPPWAPAHGYRAKQQYQYVYYPSRGVYYAPQRGVWFWSDGKHWQVGAQLPIDLQGGVGGGVNIELDSEQPYQQNDEVVRQYGGPKKGHGRHGRDED